MGMTEGATAVFEPITSEILGKFHRAKNVHGSDCTRCGNSVWTILSVDSVPAQGLPSAVDDGTLLVSYFLPILTLRCKNCGTIWMIDRQMIDDWVRDEAGREEHV